MLTQIVFKAYMSELLSLKEGARKVHEAVTELEPDFGYFSFGRHETLIVNILKTAMHDDEDWIGYWLYELDCGKDFKLGSVTIHSKKVQLKTIDDLYNLLKRRQLRKGKKGGKIKLD